MTRLMIVGMDFGTTNSGMSVYDGRTLRLLPLDPANNHPHVARTALYITNQKRVYIGRGAVEKYYEQNLNRKVKFEPVWVGEVVMTYAELPDWVRDVYIEKDVLSPGRLFLSFKTSLSASHYFGTTVGTDFYFIEDIAALYLYITRRRAERLMGQDIRQIVLGRPVRFSVDPQLDSLAQQRLLHAAFRAGYDEVYLQYEPIAAAYFYETGLDREQNVLVFDFGGGTLDISVVRLGDPQHREILATSGIPIAGDVFDQKLVSAKLPPHFGENSSYRADNGTPRPMPGGYYDAFSSWQSILELNTPRNLETLERIARTSNEPRRVRALISLISSSYGLKIFDQAEAAKRDLSQAQNTLLRVEGPGFHVQQLVTRADFERLIAQDREAIEALIDEVMAQAGLAAHQIDAVVRTGGSSQIPVFIKALQQRFGVDKVQEIDTFSSVTSGLGILAYRLAQGEIEATPYHSADWTYGGHLRETEQKKGVPAVDMEIVKKFVDLQENESSSDLPALGLVALGEQGEVRALLHEAPGEDEVRLGDGSLAGCLPASLVIARPGEKIILMTSEYRFLLKTPQELADLNAMGLRLVDTEALYTDEFGEEFVSGLQPLPPLEQAGTLLMVTTSGYAKLLRADTVLPRLGQIAPLRLEKLPGYPAALIPVDERGEALIFSSAGSVQRVEMQSVRPMGGRIMKLADGERVIRAVYAPDPVDVLVMNERGRGKRFNSQMLPSARQRVMADALAGLAVDPAGAALWAVTSRRLLPVCVEDAPVNGDQPQKPKTLLKLHKHEKLIGLGCLRE